jgi:quercetin dioxygenase-like cupin family protein
MKLLAMIASLCLLGLPSADVRRAASPSVPRAASSKMAMQRIEITRNGSVPSTSGPAAHFVGSVHVVPLFQSNDPLHAAAAGVTFEPGARTAWHTHPLGQILIVTEGVGWVQQWGGPVEIIRKGDVVRIPHVKHWHGATATTSMTHIAIVEPLDGKTVDWMEQVSSNQYHGPQP